jgi:hypothetical protein
MRRKRRVGASVIMPEPQVVQVEEREEKVDTEGMLTASFDAIPEQKWVVHPPSRIEPEDKVEEFPLPPVWTLEWKEEWEDILFPPYPDEVTSNDAAGNSQLHSSTIA